MPFVNDQFTENTLKERCEEINAFEKGLIKNDTIFMKFFLHISKNQQAKRIQQRLSLPHKRWKYSVEDEKAAEKWEDYQVAHEAIINNCNNNKWIIIPSDKKWFRNYAVAKILTNHLESLHLNYPES